MALFLFEKQDMQRISTLLQKLKDIADKQDIHTIDVDLMLDFTRVMYADLLEMRSRLVFTQSIEETPVKEEVQETNLNKPDDENNAEEIAIQDTTGMQSEETNIEPIVEDIRTEAITQQHAHVKEDIRRFIGINEKYQFVEELFAKDANAYEATLNHLNSFTTYPEAINWLDEVHSEHNWNDENDTVTAFYAIINHFYASR